MKVKDFLEVCLGEIKIYHYSELLFEGWNTEVPEELLDAEITEIAPNYDIESEFTWIEVYV